MPMATLSIEPVCISCKRREEAELSGAEYAAKGGNGMQVRFWLCNPCAIRLAPVSQGPMTLPSTLRG